MPFVQPPQRVDFLSTAPPPPPPLSIGDGADDLLPLVRRLEGSGDTAISRPLNPKLEPAVGRYQIQPGTARTHGFAHATAEMLMDPEYNTAVATKILRDLHRKYGGDRDAILAAYNAGPGRADRWIAGGKDLMLLPPETRKYLANAGISPSAAVAPVAPQPVAQSQFDVVGPIINPPTPDFAAPDDRSFGGAVAESLGPAFRQENAEVALYNAFRDSSPRTEPTPDYDAFDDIAGYEDYANRFVDANTPEATAKIKNQVDKARADLEFLSSAGWGGFAAKFIAGVVDPLVFVPIGGQLKAGDSALRMGFQTMRAAMLGTAAQQGVLMAAQPERTVEDAAANVAIATFLGGVLGTGAGKLRGFPLLRAGVPESIPPAAIPDEIPGPSGVLDWQMPENIRFGLEDFDPEEIPGLPPGIGRAPADIDFTPRAATPIERLESMGPLPELKTAAPAMGVVDESFVISTRRLAFKNELVALGERLKTLPKPEPAAIARLAKLDATLTNLKDIDARLAEEGLEAAPRREFLTRRDELLADTTPEKIEAEIEALSAPLEARRIIENQRVGLVRQINDATRRIREIEADRALRNETMTQIRALLPRLAQDLVVPGGLDPLQPGYFAVTAKELAEETSDAALFRAFDDYEISSGEPITDVPRTPPTGGGAGGGAQVTNQSDAQLKSMLGLDKALKWSSPMLMLSKSAVVETRRVAQDLLETPWRYVENALGNAPRAAVETLIKMWQGPLATAIQEVDRLYVQYRSGAAGGRKARMLIQAGDLAGGRGAKLSFDDFKTAIARAMRREDKSPIPEVAEAARVIRKTVIDPLKEEALFARLLTKEQILDSKTAPSYLTRIWNVKKILAQQPAFTKMVVTWMKREQSKIASDTTEAAQMEFANLTDGELQDIADQIVDDLRGTPGGRIHSGKMPVALKSGKPLKERTFSIPDLYSDGTTRVEDFLEDDIEMIMKFYVRTMAPDVEIAKRFGSADMGDAVNKIKDAYTRRAAAAKTEAERLTLGARRDADLLNLGVVRDRLRGTDAAAVDAGSIGSRTVRGIKDYNFLRMMGGMTISSFPDAAMPVFKEGLRRSIGAGLIPMMRNMSAFKASAAEVQKAGTALDMTLGSRGASLADIGDDFGRNTKFERGLGAATKAFGTLALMNSWNSALKHFSGVLIQDRILEHVAAVARGDITPEALEWLASSRIDRNAAERIAAQFKKHGRTESGVKIANTDAWDGAYAVADRQTYRAALLRDVDQTIISASAGDLPKVATKLLGSPALAQLIFQFHSFSFAAVNKVLLAGVQRRDMATLNGAFMMVGLGALTYYVKTLQAGRTPSTNPGVVLSEAIDRSGITGSLYDVNNIIEKLSRGHIGINAMMGGPPISRYASRSIAGALLGPTFGTALDATQTIGTAFDVIAAGEFEAMSEGDKRALIRMVPAQNLFYLRSLLDAAADDTTGR